VNHAAGALEQQLEQLETLLHELEQGPESPIRTQARDVVRAVLALHASGLARIVHGIGTVAGGPALMSALSRDPLVAGLLLLHDIHPDSLDTRVRAALDALAPTLAPQGARVAQVDVEGGVVRVRVEREPGSRRAPAAALRSRIQHALIAAAPDAGTIEIDVPDTEGFVPVTEVRMRRASEVGP
jgi:hypothetical protein